MTNYTGKIIIDGVDFWQWVQTQTKDAEAIYASPYFAKYDIDLVNVKTSFIRIISNDRFATWIVEKHLPNPAHEATWNTPVWNEKEQQVEIDFAAGTENPDAWADAIKPEWLKNKTR